MKKSLLIVSLLGLMLSACAPLFWNRTWFRGPDRFPGFKSGYPDYPASNGESIYFSATNNRGETIRYVGGTNFDGMMMTAYLTCAACHGTDGRGGVHLMHMQVMDAPDIRYAALSEEEEEHNEAGEGDDHSEYNLQDFRQAVIEGKHPDGEPLSPDMPRWIISEEDLADLFEFLKSLP